MQLNVNRCVEFREGHFPVLGDTNNPMAQNACPCSANTFITLTVTFESGTGIITNVTSGFKEKYLTSHKLSQADGTR